MFSPAKNRKQKNNKWEDPLDPSSWTIWPGGSYAPNVGTKEPQGPINDIEIWIDIPSWMDLYQASSLGRIRSVVRTLTVDSNKGYEYIRSYGGQILSPKKHKAGYLYVNLWKGNKGYMRAVHRLVGEAFNEGFSDELVCNHKDFNKENNCPENLEFVTQLENVHWSKENGRY